MKAFFYLLVAGLLMMMVACNRPATPDKKIVYSDTAGLAAFQQWKTQHELQDATNYYAASSTSKNTPVKKVVYKKAGSGSMTSSSSNPAMPAKKKGWSKAAKGTAIGAGSGAVVGALVSKKKGKGAAIGGVLGAGIGYLIGRDQDKKDGRY